MKQIYTLLLLLISLMVSHAQSGELDLSFGDNGIVTTQVALPYSFANGTVVQADGKIIAAGYTGTPDTYQGTVVRYNTDGTLDDSFGDGGKLIIQIGTAKSFVQDVALQQDGKIVLGARTWNNVSGDFAVVRLNADGSLDSTFGTGGITIADSGEHDSSTSILIADDGKIYLGGDSDSNFSISKFNTDGSLDTDFGTNGWSIITYDGSFSHVQDMAFQEDGQIILGGFIVNPAGRYQMAAARINTDGTLDNSFGIAGKVAFSFGVDHDIATTIAIQPDGKIVLGGHSYIRSNPRLAYDFAVARLDANGDLDNTFGNNGVSTAQIVDEANYANDIIIQEDGRIILAGRTVKLIEYDFAMLRFNTDGTLDESFGNNGKVKTDVNGRNDQGIAVALQPDNKIIFAGYSFTPDGNGSEFTVVRYHNDDTMATEDFQNADFSLYPNPAREQLSVEMSDASSVYQVEIFDVLGKQVYSTEIQGKGQINVSSLASGTYLVKLNSNLQTSTVRFVKQ